MSARTDLIAWAKQIRGLEHLPELAAERAAPLVEAEAKKTAAAGTDPYGVAWPPKKNGKPALVRAADHVTARAVASYVVIELDGPEVFHEMGAQEKPVRRVIPDIEVPPAISAAMDRGCELAFNEIMGGA